MTEFTLSGGVFSLQMRNTPRSAPWRSVSHTLPEPDWYWEDVMTGEQYWPRPEEVQERQRHDEAAQDRQELIRLRQEVAALRGAPGRDQYAKLRATQHLLGSAQNLIDDVVGRSS